MVKHVVLVVILIDLQVSLVDLVGAVAFFIELRLPFVEVVGIDSYIVVLLGGSFVGEVFKLRGFD